MRISTVKKVLLGLTAFSLFVTPAQASDITDRDGNPLIDPNDNVHNLYAQQIEGNIARSHYDKFSLDQNQIANMHFNRQGESAFASDLINTVNHRIDINGTVNAIRNGAIDGNLYFLSPEGIAIGASGVINAGGFNAQSDGGSVDIKGIINARNNISLVAQNITVDGAALNANTNINFSDMVNAGSTVNTIANLKMSVDPSGNGDIIIQAESTTTLDITGGGINPVAVIDTVSTNINGATLNASGNITVETNANRSFTSAPTNDGSVNLQAIMINANVADLDSAYAQKLINESNYEAPSTIGGTLTDINNSTLTAGGNLNISTVEQNNATLVNGAGNTVGATVLAINHNAKTLLTNSTVNAASVNITATQSGEGISSTVNEVSGGIAEFGIGFNAVKRTGETLVNLRGSDITANIGNINIRAEDSLNVNLTNAIAQNSVVGTPAAIGKSTNNAAARVLIDNFARNANVLRAVGDINIDAFNGANANVNVASVSSNYDRANSTATASDNAAANITIADTGHKFSGAAVNLSSKYKPIANSNITSAYRSSALSKMNATSELGGGANIEVSNNNSFNAALVNFSAVSGNADQRSVNAQLRPLDGSSDISAATVNTSTVTNVKVGSQIYDDNANVNVESIAYVDRHALANACINDSSSGRDAAVVNANDKVTANIGADNAVRQSVNNLTVNAIARGTSNLKATGTTGYNSQYSKTTVDNISDITVGANVGGKWTVDNLTVKAASNDNANVHALQGSAGSANGGDIALNNSLGGNTNATLDKGASISANSVDISARSIFSANGYNGEESYSLVNYFGQRSSEDMSSALTVDKKTSVDINGSVESNGAQSYSATSDGYLLNAVNTAGRLDFVIGETRYASADTAVAVDNKIRVGKDAALKSAEDLSMRATDAFTIDSISIGTNSGSNSLINLSKNTLERKNAVDVKGSVEADGIINFDVGTTPDNLFPIEVSIAAESANNTFWGLTSGSEVSTYDLTENNAITVNGSIRGADDVNLRANGGNVTLQSSLKSRGSNSLFYRPEELAIGNGAKFNGITVNGAVQAGIANGDINIDISGTVVPSNFNISGSDNGGTLKVNANTTVDYEEGDMEYGKELVARLNALNVLIDQYYINAQSDVNTAAVAGYVAERDRVTQKLRDIGLMISEGNNESAAAEGVDIRCVELGNISSIGGNLNLTASTVDGNGTLKTAGASNVNINNTSNAYLILNDIIRDSTVGNITLNGKPRYSGDPAFAPTVKIDSAAERGSGNITVLNNPNIATVNVTANSNGAASTYTPHPDILVQGSIENFYGDISITNTRGDIDIADRANVSGKNILIESAGTLNQGYVDGMLNIGKSLENLYAKETDSKAAEARNHINPLLASDKYERVIAANIDGGSDDGRISGSNIYLAADDININGVIQSGYDSYTVSVDSDGNNRHSGAVYNSDKGYYDYYVPVTREDDRLIVDDIETGGGQIYISGRIASTGKGRIFAANGLADINVVNDSNLPIELGNVINNNRSGKITIVDTGNDTWTEFIPGQTRVITNYAQMLKEHFADGMLNDLIQTSSNNLDRTSAQYLPANGMRFNWTDGSEQRTSSKLSYRGLSFDTYANMTLDSNQWNNYMKTVTPNEQSIEFANIDKGAFLSLNNPADKADNNLYLTAESQRLYYNYVVHDNALLVFNNGWDYSLQTLQTYTFHINASKPIELGFIGKQHAPININSNGDVRLAGNVQVGDTNSKLSVASNNGAISQAESTVIRAEDVSLNAHGDISGINIESPGRIVNGTYIDQITLETISNGNVDINVSGSVLGNSVARNLKVTSVNGAVGSYQSPWIVDAAGTVEINAHNDIALGTATGKTLTIGKLSSDNGTVHLFAYGDGAKIVQSPEYQTGQTIDINEQIKRWVDAGLIAPTNDYEGAYVGGLKKAVNDYAADIGAEYQTYADGKSDYETLKTTVATEYQEYLSIKDGYRDRVNEVDEIFEEYLLDSQSLRNSLEDEFNRMLQYREKTFLTDGQRKTLARLETKFAGVDSANAYYIVHAAEELKNDAYIPFIGYDDIDSYMISTHEGQLMTKYGGFDSADAYLQTTNGYSLEQKYGKYATVEDFLNTDEKYRELVAARDNVSFPNTLENLLAQEALEREANAYNIKSAHLYINNKKLR